MASSPLQVTRPCLAPNAVGGMITWRQRFGGMAVGAGRMVGIGGKGGVRRSAPTIWLDCAALPACTGRIDELVFKPTPEVWGYFSVKSGGGIHEFSDSQVCSWRGG